MTYILFFLDIHPHYRATCYGCTLHLVVFEFFGLNLSVYLPVRAFWFSLYEIVVIHLCCNHLLIDLRYVFRCCEILCHLYLLLLCQESYTYRDPITEFLECLYVNFDFDGAQQKLRECETVMICQGL